jgi:hypothetical protein
MWFIEIGRSDQAPDASLEHKERMGVDVGLLPCSDFEDGTSAGRGLSRRAVSGFTAPSRLHDQQ